jgi:hypothetical protein
MELGEHGFEDDEVGVPVLKALDRILAVVGRLDFKALIRQEGLKVGQVLGVIVGNENFFHGLKNAASRRETSSFY